MTGIDLLNRIGWHWEDRETTDYWCPTDQEWCMCPGPCPDGREHTPKKHIRRLKAPNRGLTIDELRELGR